MVRGFVLCAAFQKCVQPVGPSYAAPSTVTPEPSATDPITVHPAGTSAVGKVASREWSSPPPRMRLTGSTPVAAPTAWSGSGISNASRRTSMATPRLLGEMAGVGEQAVGHVDHRGRAGLGGDGARVVRRLGTAIGLDQHARGAEATPQDREPAGRPSLASTESEHVPGLRARPQHRRLRARPEHGHRDHQLVGRREVSADDRGADDRALLGEALREVQRPLGGQVAGCREPDRQRVGASAHRVDVGEVRGRGPMADVAGGDPVAPEVAALDEQVGGHHDVAVADAQHRRVVAGTDQHVLPLSEDLAEPIDQRELACFRDRRVSWEGHGHIPPDRVRGRSGRTGPTCRARPTAR